MLICFANIFFDINLPKSEKKINYSHRCLNYINCQNAVIRTLLQLLNKHWIYFFFSSSHTQKIYHLLGCLAIGINSSFNSFFKNFAFFKFNMPSQNSNKNDSIRNMFRLISIVKFNVIKIYIKNAHSITKKSDITRIFIIVDSFFI